MKVSSTRHSNLPRKLKINGISIKTQITFFYHKQLIIIIMFSWFLQQPLRFSLTSFHVFESFQYLPPVYFCIGNSLVHFFHYFQRLPWIRTEQVRICSCTGYIRLGEQSTRLVYIDSFQERRFVNLLLQSVHLHQFSIN